MFERYYYFSDASDAVDKGGTEVEVSAELEEAYLFRLPRSYFYADYVWPGVLITADQINNIADFVFRPSDILICSYPKSGWFGTVLYGD